tara:strand:- start:430 stop:843 length:414 start_codon:yes stop_codon:yes gene_type:complete
MSSRPLQFKVNINKKLSDIEMREECKRLIDAGIQHRLLNKAYYKTETGKWSKKISFAKERVLRYTHNKDKANALTALEVYKKLILEIDSIEVDRVYIKDKNSSYDVDAVNFKVPSDIKQKLHAYTIELNKNIQMYCN